MHRVSCWAVGLLVGAALCACVHAQPPGGNRPPDPARLRERDDLGRQALQLYREGKLAETLTVLEKMVALERELFGNVHPEVAGSLVQLSELYEQREDWDAARRTLQELLTIQTKLYGAQHWQAANARLALAHLERLARLDPPARQRLQQARQALAQAHVFSNRTDYARAEPLLRQALATFAELLGPEDRLYGIALNNLGVLCQDTGDFQQAAQLFRKSLEVTRQQLGEQYPGYVTTLHNLGDLYSDAGDFAQAEPLLRRAVELAKALRREDEHSPVNHQYVQFLANLAKLHHRKGENAEAEQRYREALTIIEKAWGNEIPLYATELQNLSVVYLSEGAFDKAEQTLRQALDLKKKLGQQDWPVPGSSQAVEGDLYYARGEYDRAEPLLREALHLVRNHLELTARVQSERRQLAQAQFLRTRLDRYLSLAVRRPGAAEQAYQEMLTWKGLVFARQRWLRLQRTATAAPESAPLLNELQQTIGQLAKLTFAAPQPGETEHRQRQIQELSERKEKLESQLASQSADFRSQQALTQQTPARLQAALPAGMALVDYLEYADVAWPHEGLRRPRAERRLLAVVLRSDRPVALCDLGPVEPVAQAVDEWRRTLFGEKGDRARSAGALRRLIWQPLASLLDGVQAVLVSPDGALTRFPLAALPGSRPETYLLEELPCAVLPVPQLLPEFLSAQRSPPENGSGPASLLVVGDVDFAAAPGAVALAQGPLPAAARGGHAEQFLPLPGTARELVAIREMFTQTHPQGTVHAVRGPDATKQTFRRLAPDSQFLHLATHGFFAPSELRSAVESRSALLLGPGEPLGYHPGLMSGLALAGANRVLSSPSASASAGDDGILTALEVAELDLRHAELVVLSACDTGLGRVAGGEGILGLQRAFQMAGAHTVIASLWKVDDEVTQALMTAFYDQLWQNHLPPLQALRQAQLQILNGSRLVSRPRGIGPAEPSAASGTHGRADPRLWAAWVLSGDPGKLAAVPVVAVSEPAAPSETAPAEPGAPPAGREWRYGLVGGCLALLLLLGLAVRRVRRRATG